MIVAATSHHVASPASALTRPQESMWPRRLTCQLFGPRDGLHALGFLAGAIVVARLLQRSLGRRKPVRRRPAGAFRLLRRRGTAPILTLHVLRRCSASLRRLI